MIEKSGHAASPSASSNPSSSSSNVSSNYSGGEPRWSKLLSLLQGAQTSPGLRRAAGKQLALSFEHLHPKEGAEEEDVEGDADAEEEKQAALKAQSTILRGVLNLLLFDSDDLDVKMGAAFCLQLLAPSLALPPSSPNKEDSVSDSNSSMNVTDFKTLLYDLDLKAIHDREERLLGNSRSEENRNLETDDRPAAPNVQQQKRQMRQALGMLEGIDDSLANVVEDADLDLLSTTSTHSADHSSSSLSSARERAMHKRRAKQTQQQQAKRQHLNLSLGMDRCEWLSSILSILRDALLFSQWHSRMGALYGLQALHDSSLALSICSMLSRGKMQLSQKCIEQLPRCIAQLLTLLVRDGFVDFLGGDQASAPVREFASRVLLSFLIRDNDVNEEEGDGRWELFSLVLDKLRFLLDPSEYTWNNHLTALLPIQEALKSNYVPSSEIVDSIVAILMREEEAELEDMEEETVQILQVLAQLPTLTVQDPAKLIIRLESIVLHSSDISVAPAHVLAVFGRLGHRLDARLVLPFVLHSSSQVRARALTYLDELVLPGDALTTAMGDDFVLQQLFQCCLLDDDQELAVKAQRLLLKIHNANCLADVQGSSDIWKRWLKTLATPLDKCLPADLMVGVSLDARTGQATAETACLPAWTLGTKAADLMLLTMEDIWRRRLSGISVLKAYVPQEEVERIRQGLSRSRHGYHLLLLPLLLSTPLHGSNYQASDLVEVVNDTRGLESTSPEYVQIHDMWQGRLDLIRQLYNDDGVGDGNDDDGDDKERKLIRAVQAFIRCEQVACVREYICQLVASALNFDALLAMVRQCPESAPQIVKYLADIDPLWRACRQNLVGMKCLLTSQHPGIAFGQADADFVMAQPVTEEMTSCLQSALFYTLRLRQQGAVTIDWSGLVHDVNQFIMSLERQHPPSLLARFVAFLVEQELLVDWLPAFLPSLLQTMTSSAKSAEAEQASALLAHVLRVLPALHDRHDYGDSTASGSGLTEDDSDNWEAVKRGHRFLRHLQNPASFVVDIPRGLNPQVRLRPYQLEGYRWLCFLAESGLHGALCDDMGLGKTLQTLCALKRALDIQLPTQATDSSHPPIPHHDDRSSNPLQHDDMSIDPAQHNGNHQDIDDGMSDNQTALKRCCLVVCPSSVTGHWQRECAAYFPTLRATVYQGPPDVRRLRLPDLVRSHEILIASYDLVRNDIEALEEMVFLYCVLDEGHLIRSHKSRVSQACRRLRARHRLILTGTPIQNDVLDLWTLFDFLLPGYLGSDNRGFVEKYARPIMAISVDILSSTPTQGEVSSVKDYEEAERRLQVLHKQVLPFVLRRMKDEVLQDLPAKTILDLYCEPLVDLHNILDQINDIDHDNPAQKDLDFEHDKTDQINGNAFEQNDPEEGDQDKEERSTVMMTGSAAVKVHALQLACVHPLLATGDPLTKGQLATVARESPKLAVLRELIEECGLGNSTFCKDDDHAGHRLLVFAQHRIVLDAVQAMLAMHYAHLQYMRLDGSTPSNKRGHIAHDFNHDPRVKLLLLTTAVGGLGLNLTGADVVVFLEHDWNPQRDLQAMDRAHRLGQRRAVTVYRVLCRGTLEERIMGLQRWKLRVAATVVSAENASVANLSASGNLVDLLEEHHSVPNGVASWSSNDASASRNGITGSNPKDVDSATWKEGRGSGDDLDMLVRKYAAHK
jgi:SNF2 family DNA or RNA helicase